MNLFVTVGIAIVWPAVVDCVSDEPSPNFGISVVQSVV